MLGLSENYKLTFIIPKNNNFDIFKNNMNERTCS